MLNIYRSTNLKNTLLYILSLFLFLFNIPTPLFAQPESAKAKIVSTATVTYIQGCVEVKKLGSKEWLPAKLKMTLHEKDKLRTKLISNVELQFEDGSIIKIGENTVVGIEKLIVNRETLEQDFSIKLWLGKIRTRLEKLRQKSSRFEIITPTAIVGVRGTIFIVCVDEDKKTKTVVESGQVYFRGSKQSEDEKITLKSNEFSVSSPDGTEVSPPKEITPEELNKLKEDVKEIKTPEIKISEEKLKQERETTSKEEVKQTQKITKEESSVDTDKQLLQKKDDLPKKVKEEPEAKANQLTTSPLSIPLTVSCPSNGALLSKNYSDFKGTSAPEHKITLLVLKGYTYTTTSDKKGNWSINQVSLPEGDGTINITTTSQDNTVSESASLNLTVDTSTPKPKIILPSDGSTLNSIQTDISGNAEAHSSVDLIINNQKSLTTTADDTGNYSFNEVILCKPTPVKINHHFSNQNKFVNKIPKLFLNIVASPPNNVYTFKVMATDKVGNISEPTACKVSIMVPIILSINDREVQLFGPNYSYTYDAPNLELGHNNIKVIASYEKGISQQILVTTPFYDPIPPFTLTKRKDLREISGKYFLVISRSISDNDGGSGIYRVTANDIPMTKVGDNEYEISYSSRKYPANFFVKIKAEDWAGNITTEHLYIDWEQIKKEFSPDVPDDPNKYF